MKYIGLEVNEVLGFRVRRNLDSYEKLWYKEWDIIWRIIWNEIRDEVDDNVKYELRKDLV